jgi:dihydrolipoamide dehydrogenase
LGVVLERGGIKVDEKMRTNIEGVFAAGDVTGFSLLAHTASREAEVVINNLCGQNDTMCYDAIPGIVYTNPEVAGVGLTEEEAQKRGIEYICAKLPMAYSGRFVAENEGGEGLCKVITDKTSNRVIGVHMLGNPCSEIISSACIAIEQGMTLQQLEREVFPHPTVAEIFKEAITL